MWLNSDDILMPNVLRFIAEQYMEHGDGIYFGNCIHFKEYYPSGFYANASDVISNFNTVPLQLSDTIIQPSSFWSKDVWLKNGPLADNFHFGFDWEWFLRAEKNNIPFYPINKSLSLYRFHKEHKSSTGGNKRRDELYEIYKIYNPRYAKLSELVRYENFKLLFIEKILFKIIRLVSGKKIRKIKFIKKIRGNKYSDYTVFELENILGML